MLLKPSGMRLGRPGQHVADILNFIVFAMFFIAFPGAEGLKGRRVVLAVGLDKLCPQASLASMPFGGPYAAKSLLQSTW